MLAIIKKDGASRNTQADVTMMHRCCLYSCVLGIIFAASHMAVGQSDFEPSAAATRRSIRDIPSAFSGSGSSFNFGLSVVESGVDDASFGGGGQNGLLGDGEFDAFRTLGFSNVITGGQRSQFGSAGVLSGNRFGGLGRSRFNNNRRQERMQERMDTQILYRTRLRVGFQTEKDDVSLVTTNLQERFRPAITAPDGSALAVHAVDDDSSEGTTAVLRGTVATHDDRLVAEQMALLEPGVSSVRNELTVVEAP